jgi:hypothetical protein
MKFLLCDYIKVTEYFLFSVLYFFFFSFFFSSCFSPSSVFLLFIQFIQSGWLHPLLLTGTFFLKQISKSTVTKKITLMRPEINAYSSRPHFRFNQINVKGLRVGRPGSNSRQGLGYFFLVATASSSGSEAHPASYPMVTGGKAAGA